MPDRLILWHLPAHIIVGVVNIEHVNHIGLSAFICLDS